MILELTGNKVSDDVMR
jgi:hypothetical protein